MANSYFNKKMADVFRDTEARIKYNEKLCNAVKNSVENQLYFAEDSAVIAEKNRFEDKAKVFVTNSRSFEAAHKYVNGKDKVCVLNFASAFNPGGGVTMGASAQEESLCRISTLRSSLKDNEIFEKYYKKNRKLITVRKMGGEYCDDCIYTPDVMVMKSDDENCTIMPEAEWFSVDVISCASPDLRIRPDRKSFTPTRTELAKIHEKRARRILDIAVSENVDVLILGAFGCGAFRNPPEIVSKVYSKVIRDYKYAFKTIEFAVYCDQTNTKNYDVFNRFIVTE